MVEKAHGHQDKLVKLATNVTFWQKGGCPVAYPTRGGSLKLEDVVTRWWLRVDGFACGQGWWRTSLICSGRTRMVRKERGLDDNSIKLMLPI